MSGTESASQDGVRRWISPGSAASVRERDAEGVELLERLLAHHHDDARLHDRQLLQHAGAALRRREVGVCTGHFTNTVP